MTKHDDRPAENYWATSEYENYRFSKIEMSNEKVMSVFEREESEDSIYSTPPETPKAR